MFSPFCSFSLFSGVFFSFVLLSQFPRLSLFYFLTSQRLTFTYFLLNFLGFFFPERLLSYVCYRTYSSHECSSSIPAFLFSLHCLNHSFSFFSPSSVFLSPARFYFSQQYPLSISCPLLFSSRLVFEFYSLCSLNSLTIPTLLFCLYQSVLYFLNHIHERLVLFYFLRSLNYLTIPTLFFPFSVRSYFLNHILFSYPVFHVYSSRSQPMNGWY